MADDQSLADLIRSKYPGSYDNMSDDDLEKAVLSKYPQYQSMVHPLNGGTNPNAANQPIKQNVKQVQSDTTQSQNQTTKPADTEKESFLSSIYDKLASPLTDLPSRLADKAAESFQHPNANDSELMARIKGFAGGALSGLGHEISGLTSPLNIGLAAASGGSSLASGAGLDTLGQGLGRVAQAASIPIVSRGISDVINKPDIAGKLSGGINAVLGGAGLAGGAVGDIAERAKAPVSDELPISELPPDLVPMGSEKEYNDEKSFGSPSREDIDYQNAAQRKGITPAPSQSVDDIFNKPQATSQFSFKNKPRSLDDINASINKQQQMPSAFSNNKEVTDQQNPELIAPSDNADQAIIADRQANNKPRYRLDINNKQAIPIDDSGNTIGPPINLIKPPELPPNEPDETPKNQTSLLQKFYDTPRGLMSVDLPYMTSAAFRQASPYVGTADWFKAFAPAAQSFGSKAAFDTINDEIASRPLFKPQGKNGELPSQAEQSGLFLASLSDYAKRDEYLRSGLAEKIPGYGNYIAASNRAYLAFMNSLRANRLEDMVDSLQSDGIDNSQNRSQVANAINTLTGRGKLALTPNSKNEITGTAAKLLSNILFSPKKIASEVQMLNPVSYINTNPVARQEMVAGLARRVGTWWGVAGLASLAGAEVSHDPTSPDFGKIKIGDTRLDPPGGLQQYLVLGSQLANGGKTSSSSGKFTGFGSKFGADTAYDDINNFVTNRFHPTAKFLVDAAKAKSSSPFHLGDSAAQLALPMYAQDMAQVAKTNPKLIPFLTVPSGAGIGTQSYNKSSFGKPQVIPNDLDKRFDFSFPSSSR